MMRETITLQEDIPILIPVLYQAMMMLDMIVMVHLNVELTMKKVAGWAGMKNCLLVKLVVLWYLQMTGEEKDHATIITMILDMLKIHMHLWWILVVEVEKNGQRSD